MPKSTVIVLFHCVGFVFFFNSSIHLPHWHSIRDHFHAEKGSCSQSRFLYMMGQNPIVQTHNSSFSDGSPKGPEAPLRSCVRSVLDISSFLRTWLLSPIVCFPQILRTHSTPSWDMPSFESIGVWKSPCWCRNAHLDLCQTLLSLVIL